MTDWRERYALLCEVENVNELEGVSEKQVLFAHRIRQHFLEFERLSFHALPGGKKLVSHCTQAGWWIANYRWVLPRIS